MSKSWWKQLFSKLRPSAGSKSSSKISQRKQPTFLNVQMEFDLTREPKPNLGLSADSIPGLSVIKELARTLRYQAIDTLIGQKISLTSIEKAPCEVRTLVHSHGVEIAEVPRDYSDGSFLKYGLLDYKFEVVRADFAAEPQGVRFLKNMGLLLDKKDVDDSIFPDAGIGFLDEMLEETRQNKLLFKIMLDSRGAYRGAQGLPEEQWMNADPDKYFPCEFVVRDACISNCSLIWLGKHFYM